MKKSSYRIVEHDLYEQIARPRVSPLKRLARKWRGHSQGLARNVLLLVTPIVAAVLVVSVFATKIIQDAQKSPSVTFETPEVDRLAEVGFNRDGQATAPTTVATTTVTTEQPTTTEPSATTFTPYERYINDYANVRQGASESAAKVTVLAPNTKVTVTGDDGAWCHIKTADGTTGYVSRSLVSASPVAEPEAKAAPAATKAPAKPSVMATGATRYVVPEMGYIRKGAGQSYPEIGFALRGQKVTVVAGGETWSQIRTENGLIGYMSNALLSAEPVKQVVTLLDRDQTVYVAVDYAYLRKGPSQNEDAVGSAEMNEQLHQMTSDGSWSKVKTTAGVVGYIRNDLLTQTKPDYVVTKAPKPEPKPEVKPQERPVANVDSGFEARNQSLYITTSAANVRQAPSVNSPRLAIVYFGQQVHQMGNNGTWSKIKLNNGVVGYISNALVDVNQPSANGHDSPAPPTANTNGGGESAPAKDHLVWSDRNQSLWVFVDSARLRAEASTSAKILQVLPRGTKLHQTASTGGDGWSKVTTPNGTVGYIHNSLVSLERVSTESSSTTPPPSSSNTDKNAAARNAVVRYAMAQIGKPYVFGGCTPSVGFDCSGLTLYAYNMAGYSIKAHSALAQSYLGSAVSYSYPNWGVLLPGDLMYSPGHIVMYIGNGQIIEAPDRGMSVRVVALSSYHTKTFTRVRRLIP